MTIEENCRIFFMDHGRFFEPIGEGKIQKNIIPPSKIVDGWGRTIPRCWSGGCGHGGGRSETLALAESRSGLTDSSVEPVLT
jgi:hypothetical protein